LYAYFGLAFELNMCYNIDKKYHHSYYASRETGFYYLQSRYYDPGIGRFINADTFASTGQSFLGYNMFAYCLNNPITGYDPTGTWDWGWEESAQLGVRLFIVGVAILLSVPSGGSSLAFGANALVGITVAQTATATVGAAVAGTGIVVTVGSLGAATISCAKQSKKSGKEKGNDKPSWVNQNDIDPNKSAHENTRDLLNAKYGPGNWKTGPRSEYNKIVKWITRSLLSWLIWMAEFHLEG
jgi:RHS repeat-associated protein